MGRDSLQNAVHLWSEKLFPGISGLENGFMTHQAAFVYDVKSSLVLQMALGFNLIYLPVWVVILLASYINKYSCYGWFVNMLLGVGLASVILLELARLYLGMVGNLSEQVAELSSFWFTTLLIQQPLVIIALIVSLSTGQILEVCALTISTIFMGVQLLVSFAALRNVARHRDLWKHYQPS